MGAAVRAAVGLGNPGRRYARTRHNLGFRVVDRLAAEGKGRWTEAASALTARVSVGPQDLLLVKPQSYMNSSGTAVANVVRDCGLALDELLVVVDDVNLEAGALRFRRRGSDGGHNGIRSVIESLGSRDFARLRLGVGQPREGQDLIDFVLGDFAPGEENAVEAQVREAARGVVCWTRLGIEAAMNQFNSV